MPISFPPSGVSISINTYSPTPTGFSAVPTNCVYEYIDFGGVGVRPIILIVRQNNAGTSDDVNFTIPLPVTAATIPNMHWGAVTWLAIDNGSNLSTPAQVYIGSGDTSATIRKDTAFANWTNSGGKSANFTIMYLGTS